MVHEFWGTLSIYDHRDPIFITSLILFDRIVIPIPPASLDTLTSEEVDRLSADASYLEKNGAAIIYDFRENEFRSWQRDVIREALTVKASDSLYDTRLMLATKTEKLKPKNVYDVTAIPVYGAKEKFSNAYKSIAPVSKDNILLELGQLITVPGQGSSLESIIELRNQESFQSARRALRDWQFKKMGETLEKDSEKGILLAKEEFEQMLKRYEYEISKGKFGKTKALVTSLLALGSIFSAAIGHLPTAIALMSGAVPNLFTLKESRHPAWKDLQDKKFEPAGVIYEANKLLQ